MTLQEHIDFSIYNYPILYRCIDDPRMSRLLVLNQMFLVIGNGYEWERDSGKLTTGTDTKVTLPEGYYSKELYIYNVETEKIDAFKAFMASKGKNVYKTKEFRPGQHEFCIETTEEEAKAWAKDWHTDKFGMRGIDRDPFIMSADARLLRYEDEPGPPLRDLCPYPLSRYSALVELTSGRSDALSRDGGYSFDEYPPHPEWLDGAIEIATETLAYYNDPYRYYYNDRYTDRMLPDEAHKYACAEVANELDTYKVRRRYLSYETPEEYVKRKWESYRNEQIEMLTAFLNKFTPAEIC